jgi:tetratricopeptide (TPR) repeat protein
MLGLTLGVICLCIPSLAPMFLVDAANVSLARLLLTEGETHAPPAGKPWFTTPSALADKALSMTDGLSAAHRVSAWAAVTEGDSQKAASAWKAAGTTLSDLVKIAATLERASRADLAIVHLESVRLRYPSLGTPWCKTGDLMLRLGDCDAAIEAYVQALATRRLDERKTGISDMYFGLGDVYRGCGQVPKAEDSYDQAIATDDFTSSWLRGYSYYKKAEMMIWMEHTSEAVEVLAEALRLDPGLYQAHDLLGVAHMRNSSPQLAEEHLLAAMSLEPAYVWPYLHLAELYADSGDCAASALQVAQAAKIAPLLPNGRSPAQFLEELGCADHADISSR